MRVSDIRVILLANGLILVAAAILSESRSSLWWVKVTDFLRLQIALGRTATVLVYVLLYGVRWKSDALFLGLFVLALGFQVFRIFPYLPIAPKQVGLFWPSR